MVFQNHAGTDNSYRVQFETYNGTTFNNNNTPLLNLKQSSTSHYTFVITPSEDGYIYLSLRTNNIPQESYITIDNLVVTELPQ